MADNGKDGNDDSGKLLYCSFCGKSQHEVRKLIAGPSVFICDECVDLCNDIIKEESKELNKVSSARKVNWLGAENQEIFRKMFLQVKDSETYFEFMENGLKDFEEDKKFALALFKNEIINSEFLHNYIEDKSIYWLDDIDLCCSMALKTLKTAAPDKEISILSLYKEDDDEKVSKDEFNNILTNVGFVFES
mgnify:CR=1 FL=1